MRVQQCCCGCSLQTGTLILLWLGVIFGIGQIVNGISAILSPMNNQQTLMVTCQLPWSVVAMVVTVYALIGVETRRPSFILPYIIVSVMSLIGTVMLLIVFWIGSIAMKDSIIDFVVHNMPNMRSHPDSKQTAEIYNSIVFSVIFISVISIMLGIYFTIVVYSYYKQLQEELSGVRTDGMIYTAPLDQKSSEMAYNDYPPAYGAPTVPYPQPNLVYPPQQNLVYPQHSQVYPQLPEQKQ